MKFEIGWGRTDWKNLLAAVIVLFAAVLVIVVCWVPYLHMAASGDKFILTYEDIRNLVITMFAILILGLISGFEIGRYVEAEFGKRRTEKAKS